MLFYWADNINIGKYAIIEFVIDRMIVLFISVRSWDLDSVMETKVIFSYPIY